MIYFLICSVITRETFKQVRNIKVRPCKQTDGSPATVTISEALAQRVGAPARMIDCKHANFISLHGKEYAVTESRHSRPPHRQGFLWKMFRIFANSFREALKFLVKFAAKSWLSFLEKSDCLVIVKLRQRQKPQSLHFQPKRLCISSRTCSHGMPSPGFFRNSSARRSSSSACSGVRSGSNHPISSPNSDQISSTNCRFSSVGKVRTCSIISARLMLTSYPFLPEFQAGNGRLVYSALRTPHSVFS